MPQTDDLDSLLAAIRTTFDVDFEPLQVDDGALEVLTIRNMQAHLDGLLQRKAIHNPLKDLPLWAKVWPGSFVLGRLLRKYEPEGKNLLELGAGCGILSMVAARYGFKRIVLSDIVEDALRFATLIRKSCKAVDAAMDIEKRTGFRQTGKRMARLGRKRGNENGLCIDWKPKLRQDHAV